MNTILILHSWHWIQILFSHFHDSSLLSSPCSSSSEKSDSDKGMSSSSLVRFPDLFCAAFRFFTGRLLARRFSCGAGFSFFFFIDGGNFLLFCGFTGCFFVFLANGGDEELSSSLLLASSEL